jgi:hypothetical protein
MTPQKRGGYGVEWVGAGVLEVGADDGVPVEGTVVDGADVDGAVVDGAVVDGAVLEDGRGLDGVVLDGVVAGALPECAGTRCPSVVPPLPPPVMDSAERPTASSKPVSTANPATSMTAVVATIRRQWRGTSDQAKRPRRRADPASIVDVSSSRSTGSPAASVAAARLSPGPGAGSDAPGSAGIVRVATRSSPTYVDPRAWGGTGSVSSTIRDPRWITL